MKLWFWGKDVQVILKDYQLLATSSVGKTALCAAAYDGNEEILEQMWGWCNEVQVNLKDVLLLAKDFYYGLTAWDRAAMHGNKEILEKLWCFR